MIGTAWRRIERVGRGRVGVPRRALAGALVVLWGCLADEANPWVATVDGEEIRAAELQRMLEERFEADPEAPRGDVLTAELSRLIDERVALNQATRLGVAVNDVEVEDRIRLVHGEGFGLADRPYREAVRRQMLIDRTAFVELAPRIRVPESTLADYFEKHRDELGQPERVRIRQIVVEDGAKAARLRKELVGGADFEALAREHSLAPESDHGGALPPFARGEMPAVFDRAFDLEAGELSDVFESPHGYHIFLTVERLPEQKAELAELRDELMARLTHERLQELRPAWQRNLTRSAEITVNERLLETLR